jgi:glycine dehydrogenase subunit 1
MPFIPHTSGDLDAMLQRIGVASIDDLFDEIPASLTMSAIPGVPAGLSEAEVSALMHERADTDGRPACFMGAGAYDHYVPAAVWQITTRGEFYSAYTPYQAEASQGTLQVIYEYQTMMAGLTGLDISNASLYDGATAFAEACLMALRANRKSKSRKILVPRTVHPYYREVALNIIKGQNIELVDLPMLDGITDVAALAAHTGQDYAAVVIQQPNFFGSLEQVDAITDWAHAEGALVIAIANPLTLAVLKPPGEWGAAGADVACGEGQPLGVPMSSGGPFYGYMVCREAIVRQMPGRIVGRTVDVDDKPGFTLTLQAREQHIRRSRATSNICTNQGLMVTASTIYMALLGNEGLRRVALGSHNNTVELVNSLCALDGIERAFAAPLFHEAVLILDRPVAPVLEALAAQGILGGVDIGEFYPELGYALLVCVTENRTPRQIEQYVNAMSQIFTINEVRDHG